MYNTSVYYIVSDISKSVAIVLSYLSIDSTSIQGVEELSDVIHPPQSEVFVSVVWTVVDGGSAVLRAQVRQVLLAVLQVTFAQVVRTLVHTGGLQPTGQGGGAV